MAKQQEKLGLFSAVSTGIGLIVATSCLMSLGQGSAALGVSFIIPMVVVCILNMITAASLAELNALMPNLTGGLAQYTLACLGPFPTIVSMVGGYLICNTLTASTEGAMFGIALVQITGWHINPAIISIAITLLLTIVNLRGVDMFAKIQNVVAFLLIGSMIMLGLIGTFGLGTGEQVVQDFNTGASSKEMISMAATAFWLFIGVEFIIPLSKDMKNPKKHVPMGMFLSLIVICIIQIFIVLGFHRYTLWSDLGASDSPHLLYGVNMLGKAGKVWMGIVAILAAVSTQNSVISGLSKICYGMSKINMLPSLFQKTNKQGVSVPGVLLIGGSICIIQGSGISAADDIMFIILTGSVFWMVSYIISHINVLVLRKRLPKAPRSFKVPLGPVFPLIGILGPVFMILNIDPDPMVCKKIWLLTLGTLGVLSIYAVLWIKYKMKIPVFKHISMEKVMAMENEFYYKHNTAKPNKKSENLRASKIMNNVQA